LRTRSETARFALGAANKGLGRVELWQTTISAAGEQISRLVHGTGANCPAHPVETVAPKVIVNAAATEDRPDWAAGTDQQAANHSSHSLDSATLLSRRGFDAAKGMTPT